MALAFRCTGPCNVPADRNEGMIQLKIVGPAEVTRGDDDEPVRLAGRALALLAYLAVEGEGSRQELCRLFWEERDDPSARHSLRQLLSMVRKELGVDPFLGSDPLRLNAETVSSDVADFRRAVEASDDAGLDTLVRGQILQGLDFSHSDRLGDWHHRTLDGWRQEFGTYLVRRYGTALMDGRRRDMDAALDQARRIGLDPAAFAVATDHDHALFLPTRTGRDALSALVYRSRPQLPGILVRCLDGPGNEVDGILSSLVGELPEAHRPYLIQLASSDMDRDSPLGAAATLLRALVNAPGGAGVHGQTRRLATPEAHAVAPAEFPGALATALADALDAVMDEASVIVVLPAAALTGESARVLRESLGRTGGTDGLTFILVGRDAGELSSLAIQELCPALPTTLSISLATSEAPAPGSAPPPQMRPPGSGPRAWRRVGAAALVLVLVSVGAALNWRVDPLASLDGGEVVICSDRSGVLQLYRLSPRTSTVERVSPFEVVGCPQPSGGGWNESGYLVAPVWDGDEAVVVKLDLRGNPRGDAPELARIALPRWADGPDVIFYPFGPGHSLVMAAVQENDSLRAAILDHGTWSWKEVVLPLQGVSRSWAGPAAPEVFATVRRGGPDQLVRVNLESGSVQTLTPDDQNVSRALVWGDSHIVYQVGAVGEEEDGSLELWDLDVGSGARSRLTENEWNDHEIVVNADGTGVCWKSEEHGHWSADIMFMESPRHRVRALNRSDLREGQCAWTPDGRAILYASWSEMPNRRNALLIKSVTGGAAREVVPPVSINTLVGFFRAP